MAAKKHAILSPSSAFRWLRCPPSARLETSFQDTASPAAEEGTEAHALCEHKLKKALKLRSRRPRLEHDDDEMEECSDGYVQFVLEQIGKLHHSQVFVEQHLDLTEFVPHCFGTADCVIVGDHQLHIVDFKYGTGVLVEAERNPQMMLYALGAVLLLGNLYDIETVSMSIYQPRRENVCTDTMPLDDLLTWARETLKPIAAMAYDGKGDYKAGPWCTFCRASVKCRERARENLVLARSEFDEPPELSDEEVEVLLPKLPGLVKWANDLMDYALSAAVQHGKSWDGFKLVAGRSIRKYRDPTAVAAACEKAGYHDIFDKKLITLTKMEKLMGKDTFQEVLGDLIMKPPGKPTLVPDTDKRPAIDTFNINEDCGGNAL